MVLQYLENEIEYDDQLTRSHIAKEIGVSNGFITKLTSGKTCDLDKVFSFIDYVIPEDNVKHKNDYIYNYVKTPKNLITAMEYALSNNELELLNYLIDFDYKNNDLNACQMLYRYFRTITKDSKHHILSDIESVSSKSPIVTSLKYICICYFHYYKKNYNTMKDYIEWTEEIVQEIDNRYLKISISLRIKQLLAQVELRTNCNKDKAREISRELINNATSSRILAYGYYVYGMSYLMDDIRKCEEYLVKSIRNYKKVKDHENEETVMNRLSIVKCLYEDYGLLSSDYAKAMVWIKYDENKAINHLNKLSSGKNIEKLIKGRHYKNFNLLMKSLVGFVKNGDNFLALFVRNEMKKLGFDGEEYSFVDDCLKIQSI